jgi:hypothetical protein
MQLSSQMLFIDVTQEVQQCRKGCLDSNASRGEFVGGDRLGSSRGRIFFASLPASNGGLGFPRCMSFSWRVI